MTVPPRVSAPVSEAEQKATPLTDEIMAMVERYERGRFTESTTTAGSDADETFDALRSRLVSLEQELTRLRNQDSAARLAEAVRGMTAPVLYLATYTTGSSVPSDADECPCVGCQNNPRVSSTPRTTEPL